MMRTYLVSRQAPNEIGPDDDVHVVQAEGGKDAVLAVANRLLGTPKPGADSTVELWVAGIERFPTQMCVSWELTVMRTSTEEEPI